MSNSVISTAIAGLVISDREPVTEVEVDEAVSGKVATSSWQTTPRYRYKLGLNILRSGNGTPQELQQLASHFARHFGGLQNFLITDPEDNTVIDHGFGLGDGTTTAFQLQRSMLGSFRDPSGTLYNATSKPYTNLVKNSSFETDSNSDGLADNWASYNNASATEPSFFTIVPGLLGGKAQRVSWGIPTTNTKGIVYTGSGFTWLTDQWYTISFFARATGTNVGKFVGFGWNNGPQTGIAISQPPLSTSWQRYVAQVKWNPGSVTPSNLWLTIATAAASNFIANANTGTFGDLEFDLVQVTTGQWGASDLQPVETPASATATDNPAYWPAYADGFEPVYDLNGAPTIFLDGDWRGKRQLYPYARTNLIAFSEQIDNAAWSKSNVTVTPNATTAPDGTASADSISEGTTATVTHQVSEGITATETQGELRCYSVFLKAGTLPNVIFRLGTTGDGINIDLSTGTVAGTRGAATVASGVQTSPSWNGFSRYWFCHRSTATISGGPVLQCCADATYDMVTGYTGSSRLFYAWGAMGERVSDLGGPTPYIATPSSAAVSVTDYSVSSTGVVTLASAPASGAMLSWSGAFYRRVRLEQSNLPMSRVVNAIWRGELSIISVI